MEKKAADVNKCQEKDQRCTGATPDLPGPFCWCAGNTSLYVQLEQKLQLLLPHNVPGVTEMRWSEISSQYNTNSCEVQDSSSVQLHTCNYLMSS